MSSPQNRITAAQQATCVGRERELELLEQSYEEAAQQGAHLTILKGAAGTGKSRILRAFRFRMKLKGIPVLEGDVGTRC